MSYSLTCQICGSAFDIRTYGDGACPSCQAEYVYDEGHSLSLTDAMLSAIRERLGRESFPLPSPAEHRLRVENERLQRENAALVETAKQAAYVVKDGGVVNVPPGTTIGHLWVYEGGSVRIEHKADLLHGLEPIVTNFPAPSSPASPPAPPASSSPT